MIIPPQSGEQVPCETNELMGPFGKCSPVNTESHAKKSSIQFIGYSARKKTLLKITNKIPIKITYPKIG